MLIVIFVMGLGEWCLKRRWLAAVAWQLVLRVMQRLMEWMRPSRYSRVLWIQVPTKMDVMIVIMKVGKITIDVIS